MLYRFDILRLVTVVTSGVSVSASETTFSGAKRLTFGVLRSFDFEHGVGCADAGEASREVLGVYVFGGVSKLSLEALPDLPDGDQKIASFRGMSSMPNRNEVLFLRAGLPQISVVVASSVDASSLATCFVASG